MLAELCPALAFLGGFLVFHLLHLLLSQRPHRGSWGCAHHHEVVEDEIKRNPGGGDEKQDSEERVHVEEQGHDDIEIDVECAADQDGGNGNAEETKDFESDLSNRQSPGHPTGHGVQQPSSLARESAALRICIAAEEHCMGVETRNSGNLLGGTICNSASCHSFRAVLFWWPCQIPFIL